MNINPVGTSFVTHFQTCDSTEMPSSNTADTNTMSWNANFAIPVPHTRLPAWSRVAIQPHASTSFTGPIMKRVGLCARRPMMNAHTAAQTQTFVKPAPEPETREVETRNIRRRLEKYQPAQEEAQFEGRPSSRAQVAAMIMQAKVDTSNNFMLYSSGTTLEDKKQCRRGTYVQVTPVKRYAGSDMPKGIDPVGGNKFNIYNEVMPIIIRALKKGMDEVDYTTASIAETSSIMLDIRRDPRQHVAARGVPDLSDIADVTEPLSPHMIKPPTLKAESRSPRKRIARLTSPIKNGLHRITSSIVKLVPSASPKAEPSPTKSASAPSTPLRLSPTPTKQAITPAGNSSPLSRLWHTAPENLSIEESPARPGRTFRAPSYADSSSLTNQTSNASLSAEEFSPVKFSRPVAPTPSRWNRPEPATPQALTPMPIKWTPGQSDSPIGLAALIPPSTPQMPKCTFKVETPTNAEFHFGEVSASFNSPSWMNASIKASEPRRIKTVNSARRRQSEPLLRQHFKSQARRKSLSPRKVIFQDDDIVRDNAFITPPVPLACPTAPETNVAANVSTANEDVTMATAEPINVEAEPETAVEDKPEPVHQQPPTVAVTPAEDTPNIHAPTVEHGVLNIDMRQNPDIFGAQVSSPPAPVQQLAQFAVDGCAGNAKVVVTQENSRLFVRFKLPTDYAYMFPDSQGLDESRFTTSPSAISSSPRINFNNQRQHSFQHSVMSPAWSNFDNTPNMSANADRTLVMDWPLNGYGSTQKTPSKRDLSYSVLEQTPTIASGLAQHATTLAQTPVVRTPEVPQMGNSSPLFSELTASAKPTSPLEPTPMRERIEETPIKSTDANTPTPAPSTVANVTPMPAKNVLVTTSTQSVAATPTTSFTPVNKTSPRIQVTAPSDDTSTTPEKMTPAKTTPVPNSPAAPASARQETFDDSPGRDYMRDFIKRSRQTTTTETGSPMAPSAKRQPLVAKSPNTGSPQKKRKLEKEEEAQSPPKKHREPKEPKESDGPKEPAAKRVRRTAKATKRKVDSIVDKVDDAPTAPEVTAEQVDKKNDQDDEAELDGPLTRRSTRLRTQTGISSGPRSSIPTAIKLGRSGAGRAGGAVLNSTVRSDQQELTAQTRMNTKKNKGASEYPAQVLARVAESQGDDSDNSSDVPSDSSKGRKCVVWKEPLEMVKEEKPSKLKEEKPSKGKTVPKAKATQGKTGIAKPKATSQSKRTAKLAETLGMVANGTPARPTRMTRSRTRSQI